GPSLLGIMLNLIFYGIRCTQFLFYYTTFKKDNKFIKTIVYMLLALDTIRAVFDMVYLYDYLIIHFEGDVEYLAKANWGMSTYELMMIVSAIGTAVACRFVPEFQDFQKFEEVVVLWLASAVICDVIITASLVYYLNKHKQGFIWSDTVIDRIIALTVQTGMITAIWATVHMILFLSSTGGIHLIFNYMLGSLYSNCLMSTLNARVYLKDMSDSNANSWNDRSTERSLVSQHKIMS
ncbi:hypothetical protein CONPUDRAFT_64551, partial [Coniophora puteana RWD-64-598 SS2]